MRTKQTDSDMLFACYNKLRIRVKGMDVTPMLSFTMLEPPEAGGNRRVLVTMEPPWFGSYHQRYGFQNWKF